MGIASFHSFDVHLAQKYGIVEAILIHHFSHWIGVNERLKRNFHDGRYWTYQTLDEIAAHFPYITKDEVRNAIERLCLGKTRFSKKEREFDPVLLRGNFNKTKYDKTHWYSFVIPVACGASTTRSGDLEENPLVLAPHRESDSTTPIPDTIPDTKTKEIPPPTPQGGSLRTISEKSSKKSPDQISFSFDQKQFIGITEQDIQSWKEAYPGVNVARDLVAMKEWLLSNPSKSKKTLWRGFINRWLTRSLNDITKKEAYNHGFSTAKIDRTPKGGNDQRSTEYDGLW